ncbi:MAG: DUF677 domain-containing protein [Minisyncoccia bacterium]
MNDTKNRVRSIERMAIRATTWIGSPGSLVVHTILFVFSFLLIIFGFPVDKVLLVLTTIVSLEAIYLSIFIQMSVNRSNRRLVAVRKDLEEIQEDVEDIQEDVEEIQVDVESIEKDVDEIQKDVEEIVDDVDSIQEDIEEITEDVEDISEDMENIGKEVTALGDEVETIGVDIEADEIEERTRDQKMLLKLEETLGILMNEIKEIKESQTKKPKKINKK